VPRLCLLGGYHSFWLLLFLVAAPPAHVSTGVFSAGGEDSRLLCCYAPALQLKAG